MKKKCVGKAKRLSMDIISTLPHTILEIILSLLPAEEAARTSILSREWRYKWTKIPKLEFCYYELHLTSRKPDMNVKCKRFYDIHQVLLLHQGPIHELTLHICKDCDRFEFAQIMLLLVKNNTVKKLTLVGWDFIGGFNLPMSFFSLHHLTDLCLSKVDLEHEPIFNGFGSLRSLVLDNVGVTTETLLHLLSKCPSLKSFCLLIGEPHIGGKDCTAIELFKCLPMIDCLTTCYDVFQWLILDSVPKELPTSLFHLRYFCFEYVCFKDGYGLAFLLILIKCSPNLQKIDLQIEWDHECDGEYVVVWEEYSDVWLEHLNELEIEGFANSKPEMDFVKFILARSPKLKKVRIRCVLYQDQEPEMLKTLLEAPRASPVVITVK